jgi:signal transduction histidine kinase
MFVQSNPKLVAKFRLVSNAASLICAGAGALCLTGWYAKIDILKNPFHRIGEIPLAPIAAVLLCFLALSCWLLSNWGNSKWSVYISNFFASVVVMVCCLVLVGFIPNCKLDIETALFVHIAPEIVRELPHSFFARAAPYEAVGLLLGGVALLYLARQKDPYYFYSQLTAILIALISLLVVTGYCYRLPEFHGEALYQVSFWTALLLLALSAAIFFAAPENGLAEMIVSTRAGGILLRRLLPSTILVTFLFGWLKMVGVKHHWFEVDYGTGILILLMIVTGTILIILSGRHLNSLDAERERLMEQRENLMAVLTHDLKNPLIGADRALELLITGALGPVTTEQSKFLVKLKESNEELLNNIQTLLELYRYDRGTEAMRFEDMNVLDIVRACAEGARAQAESHGITLEERLPETIEQVNGDRTALKHVIANLIHNAIKFTPAGEKIEVSAQNLDGMVMVKVKDTGKGISKEEQESLFQPFSQGTLGKKYKTGTGLGLYLCSQIVKAHLGYLSCLSEEGTGSTFVITLPGRHSSAELSTTEPSGRTDT